MATVTEGSAQKTANAALHLLLEHHKSTRRLRSEERLNPEDFFPVDARLLVGLVGWTLELVSMVGYTSSLEPLLAKCISADKKIMLLSSLSEAVKRYSLAHELGHVLLHTEEIPDCNAGNLRRTLSMLPSSAKKNRMRYSDRERQAEIFARELLMPERAVRRHFRELFGVDKLRASSEDASLFAPNAHKKRSVDVLREATEEIANWGERGVLPLVEFFGVSNHAMSSRLIGLRLVY